jgi:hypothetical protein
MYYFYFIHHGRVKIRLFSGVFQKKMRANWALKFKMLRIQSSEKAELIDDTA